MGLGRQTIQSKLTGRKLEDKYRDLNLSPSSGLLPGVTAVLTRNQKAESRQTRTTGQPLWAWGRVEGVARALGGQCGRSPRAVTPPSVLHGPSLSMTSDAGEISERAISRPGTRLLACKYLSLSVTSLSFLPQWL